MLINSLKPNISREKATAMFRGGLRQRLYGPLRITMDFHIPYHFFKLTWDNGRARTDGVMAVDAATGRLDPYMFDESPEEHQRASLDTTRFLTARFSECDGAHIVEEQMVRHAMTKGFIKLAKIETSVSYLETIYIPYWVGVYERKDKAHLKVISGLSGRFEGAKVSEIVAEWFEPQDRD
jgi:hypothetical protein